MTALDALEPLLFPVREKPVTPAANVSKPWTESSKELVGQLQSTDFKHYRYPTDMNRSARKLRKLVTPSKIPPQQNSFDVATVDTGSKHSDRSEVEEALPTAIKKNLEATGNMILQIV